MDGSKSQPENVKDQKDRGEEKHYEMVLGLSCCPMASPTSPQARGMEGPIFSLKSLERLQRNSLDSLDFGKPNGLQTGSHLGNREDKRVRLGAALEF